MSSERSLIDRFLAGDTRRYVLGINAYSESVGRLVDVDGFIDDFTDSTEFLGKPILKTSAVPRDSLVLNASLIRPFTAQKGLDARGIAHIDYFAFFRESGLALKPVKFWPAFAADYRENRHKYDWVASLMADQQSADTLRKLLAFMLDYDLEQMKGFQFAPLDQYFDPIISFGDNESFVDIGGYDGETSKIFTRHCPDYRAIHIFEPDAANYSAILANIGGMRDAHAYNVGLYDEKTTLRFDNRATSFSRLSTSGETIVQVDRLDNFQLEAVSYLKMDIEGAELNAIDGAAETIRRFLPRLAISVYHRAQDFWTIPERILTLHPGYKVYLRHYTEGTDETVMYFLP